MTNLVKYAAYTLADKFSIEYFDVASDCKNCPIRKYCTVNKEDKEMTTMLLIDEAFRLKFQQVNDTCRNLWIKYLLSNTDSWEDAFKSEVVKNNE